MEHNTHKRSKLVNLSNDEINELFNLEPLRRPNNCNSFNISCASTDTQDFSRTLINSPSKSDILENESILNLFSTENNNNIFGSCFTDSGNETGNTQNNSEWIQIKQEIMNFEFIADNIETSQNISLSNISDKLDANDNEELNTSGMPSSIFDSSTFFQEIPSDTSNVQENESNTFSISSAQIPKYSLTLLPPSVLRLYNNITSSHSEFSFAYALSAQLCNTFMPTECFINLKMALLLSIISCNYTPISIIAIGVDTSSINSIINEIGSKLAKRFICNQSNDYESVKFTKDKWIEAGSSLLAKGGVCYLGDVSVIKPTIKDRILKEIEDQKICRNIKTADLTFKLESAIWCYWDKNLINLKETDKVSMYKFLEVFGIPIATASVHCDALLHSILDQNYFGAVNNDLLMPISDLKEYISQITNRHIPLAKETSDLLDQYFLTSRSRGRLTQKGFVIINRFAESFAKLTNHKEILPTDAISAIFLAEQSFQEIFGPDMFPCPKFKLKQPMNLIGEIDEFLKNFGHWLNWYFSVFKDK